MKTPIYDDNFDAFFRDMRRSTHRMTNADILHDVRDRISELETGLARNTFSDAHVGSVAEAGGFLIDDYVECFETILESYRDLERCLLMVESA